jgi:hypothetical protein
MKSRIAGLNALDVLLLVLIKHDVTTTYGLRSKAGIGGSLALKQLQLLEENGLLTSVSGNERKARRYGITTIGEAKLLEALDLEMLRTGRLGVDRLVRDIFLEWLYPKEINGAEIGRATLSALEIYRKEKVLEADRLWEAMERLKRRSPDGSYGSQLAQVVAGAYKWLRTKSDAAMLKGQLEAVLELQELSKILPPAPHVQSDHEV